MSPLAVRRELVAALVLAALTGGSRLTLAQAQAPGQVQAQAPAPRATPRIEQPRFSFVLDLAAPPPSAVVVVPDGQILDVRLANRIVNARYRRTYSGEPAQDIGTPFFPKLTSMQLAEACEAIKTGVLAAIAADDEETVAGLMRGADSRLEAAACPSGDKSQLEYAFKAVHQSLSESRTLYPGQSRDLTVERIDASSGASLRSWTVRFRGAAPDLGWAFPTEESFLVHAIAEEMAEMALFPAIGPAAVTVTVKAVDSAAGVSGPSYDVAVQAPRFAARHRITLMPHVWDASAYAPLAADLVKRAMRAGHGRPASGASALEALVTPTATVFIAESDRVSRRLTANPADAEAHEQAAFILGAFALRESARDHSDTRMLLSRMTSHLALAAALRHGTPASRDGRFASILVSVLSGRQVEALAALAGRAGATPSPAESAWATALSIRTHGDWRKLASPARATLVERLAYFQALTSADSPSRALDDFGTSGLEPIPDWSRIALAAAFSVGEGQRFAFDSVHREIAELGRVWEVERGTPARRQDLIAALTLDPGSDVQREGPPSIRVLDWATWGAAAARHVKADVEATYRLLNRLLGDKASATEFAEAADRIFAHVPQYELVLQRRVRGDLTPAASCAVMASVIRKSPETVTAANWDQAHNVCQAFGLPGYASWFAPPVPTGTAYDADRRLEASQLMRDDWAGHIERLVTLAPYDSKILFDHLWVETTKTRPDPEEIAKAFAPFAEYQLPALRRVLTAYKRDAARRREVLEKMCAFSAGTCLELGHDLRDSDPTAAVAAYERAIAHARNRVQVANSIEWLVQRYQDQGQGERAMELATMAAETYSDGGLLTMTRLLERLGRPEEAMEYARRRSERYGRPEVLDLFLIKHRDHLDPARHATGIQAALKRVFPLGIEKVGLADFSGFADGLLLLEQEPAVAKLGLQERDVLVAVDGIRVHNHLQGDAVKSWSTEPRMRLIVSHEGRFTEIELDRSTILYVHTVLATSAFGPPAP